MPALQRLAEIASASGRDMFASCGVHLLHIARIIMIRLAVLGVGLTVALAASVFYSGVTNAQQTRIPSETVVSEGQMILTASKKKRRGYSKRHRSICDSFGGPMATCRPAGYRTCCCSGWWGQECFSIE
jgi:hypothetical protein